MWEAPGSILGSGRSLGEGDGNPLQYSCLENSMGRGAWWATVRGVTESWTRLSHRWHLNKRPIFSPMFKTAIIRVRVPSQRRQAFAPERLGLGTSVLACGSSLSLRFLQVISAGGRGGDGGFLICGKDQWLFASVMWVMSILAQPGKHLGVSSPSAPLAAWLNEEDFLEKYVQVDSCEVSGRGGLSCSRRVNLLFLAPSELFKWMG